MGGSQLEDTNTVVNLLALCASCHTEVESQRGAAYAGGWLVRQGVDPAGVEVLVAGGQRWVLLTAAGGYREVQP